MDGLMDSWDLTSVELMDASTVVAMVVLTAASMVVLKVELGS